MARIKDENTTLYELVRAMCRDYQRRSLLIQGEETTRRVKNELVYLNRRILDAVCEIVGTLSAEGFIREIGESIGYGRSEFSYFAESTYKEYKTACVKNIAKKLYLCD